MSKDVTVELKGVKAHGKVGKVAVLRVQHLTGYVGFLDVLGFADLIARDDRLQLVEQYTHAVKESVDAATHSGDLRFVLFSDSIIISTQTEEERALTSLLAACSRIFGALLSLEVPVRGAIAYGSCIRSENDEGGTIVAGRPITEAYRWEKQQDWVGISLAPSVLRRHIPDLYDKCATRPIDSDVSFEEFEARLDWLGHLLYHDQIPFHVDRPGETRTIAGFAVVPLDNAVHTINDVRSGMERLGLRAGRMRVVAPDPMSQRKCLELQTFLEHVARRWDKILGSRWCDQNRPRIYGTRV